MTITRELVRMADKRDQKPPVGNHKHPQYLTTAVTSLKKTASTPLVGDIELAEGSNITLTQDDVLKKITITAAGGAGGAFSQIIGDGVTTVFNIVHGLNTASVLVELWDLTTRALPEEDTSAAQFIEVADANTIKVTFTAAPITGQYRVVIMSGSAAGVSSLKTTGGALILGDIEFVAGTNITLAQDDALKTITITAAAGGVSKQWMKSFADMGASSSSSFNTKGLLIIPKENLDVYGIAMLADELDTQSIKIAVYELNVNVQVGAALIESGVLNTGTVSGDNPTLLTYKPGTPVTLLAGVRYVVCVRNVTASATAIKAMTAATYSVDFIGLQGRAYARIITANPVDGSTWDSAGSSTTFLGAVLVEI